MPPRGTTQQLHGTLGAISKKIIEHLNKSWNWTGINAEAIILTNEFGNVIFKSNKGDYWWICPEELSCEKIASNELELQQKMNDEEFIEDWQMERLINLAKSELGELIKTEKYCLKIPAVIGGTYSRENLGKISFKELIAFSGDLAFQIKDLPDGQAIKLKVINAPNKV